jgi:hypothetical protein
MELPSDIPGGDVETCTGECDFITWHWTIVATSTVGILPFSRWSGRLTSLWVCHSSPCYPVAVTLDRFGKRSKHPREIVMWGHEIWRWCVGGRWRWCVGGRRHAKRRGGGDVPRLQ